MSAALDRPGEVRPGEALPLATLLPWLRQAVPGLEGEPRIGQFGGGASNLTYLLEFPGRAVVLRRPPLGHRAKSAHDMVREARVLTTLRPAWPLVPEVLAVCETESLLGAGFFVMAHVPGAVLRGELPAGLTLAPEQARGLCLSLLERMAELHALEPAAIGAGWMGKGSGYVARQLRGWGERYAAARTADAPDFAAVLAWLQAHLPASESRICAIHNDFRFDNLVLDPGEPSRVRAVLDWEMATLGDPLAELGNALAYWVQADDDAEFLAMRRQPTHLPGMLRREEVLATYERLTGRPLGDFRFHALFGLFRLAAILQQIHQRFAQGLASSPEFAGFLGQIHVLHRRCERLIRTGDMG